MFTLWGSIVLRGTYGQREHHGTPNSMSIFELAQESVAHSATGFAGVLLGGDRMMHVEAWQWLNCFFALRLRANCCVSSGMHNTCMKRPRISAMRGVTAAAGPASRHTTFACLCCAC